MTALARSPDNASWHAAYEGWHLSELNPACPYFHVLADALHFTGEIEDLHRYIHPEQHPLARRLLQSDSMTELGDVFKAWASEFNLAGIRPYAHGSASVVLDAGGDFVLKLSDMGKSRPPPLPFIVQPTREHEAGGFRMTLDERCTPCRISPDDLAKISAMAEAAGYFLDDAFQGNFGRTADGVLKVLDSDAVKPIESVENAQQRKDP